MNCFRRECDGIHLVSARTLSRDPQWRQLSVRRLILMLRRTLLRETQWAVFEPNGPELWRDLRTRSRICCAGCTAPALRRRTSRARRSSSDLPTTPRSSTAAHAADRHRRGTGRADRIHPCCGCAATAMARCDTLEWNPLRRRRAWKDRDTSPCLLTAFRFEVSLVDRRSIAAGVSCSSAPSITVTPPASQRSSATARFQECSGLEVEMDVQEYQEGGRNNGVIRRIRPGQVPADHPEARHVLRGEGATGASARTRPTPRSGSGCQAFLNGDPIAGATTASSTSRARTREYARPGCSSAACRRRSTGRT